MQIARDGRGRALGPASHSPSSVSSGAEPGVPLQPEFRRPAGHRSRHGRPAGDHGRPPPAGDHIALAVALTLAVTLWFATEGLTEDQREVLVHHFTNLEGPVFALVNLPEVVKGALFARYSRTTKSSAGCSWTSRRRGRRERRDDEGRRRTCGEALRPGVRGVRRRFRRAARRREYRHASSRRSSSRRPWSGDVSPDTSSSRRDTALRRHAGWTLASDDAAELEGEDSSSVPASTSMRSSDSTARCHRCTRGTSGDFRRKRAPRTSSAPRRSREDV